MVNESANYYGILLITLMAITILGLFTEKPSATGFVVQEANQEGNSEISQEGDSFFDVEIIENDPRICVDNSRNGECSSIMKPNFCLYGTLVDYCELCGCEHGEICKNRKCVKE